ncbi:MAG: malto-oligosyltrehalose trehalohydrolase [Isosphaeraceae bacterium]
MNGMVTRRQIVGAEIVSDGRVHFRVWAPKHKEVQVVLEAGPDAPRGFALESEAEGYFAGAVAGAGVGTRYRFRLGGSSVQILPDPATRYQPEGPCGPSEVIDPLCFRWTDQAWQGIASVEGQVLYELHVGTFTPQGTWTAALQQLPYLADLGITVLEIMPMAEFPGSFGWGYDGVDLFAPFHGYGIPDDVRRLVDRAHALGLGVILDVVYNHLGPEGNVLGHYSDDYFSRKYQSEWGDTFNFDGPGSGPVREFVLANVAYWVEEFHFDGMRVDATQGLYDSSPVHILAQIARRMREAAGDRRILIVGESEPQRAGLLRGADRGGIGFDMLWSDDFHHTATVAATGNREAYYGDYLGSPQELVSVLKRGWLYQGQWDLRQGKRRGSPALDIAPTAFIGYLQNHDQIANTARGERLHARTTPGRFRALSALLLLGPTTPLLFQGQEFAASSLFLYFSDARPEVTEQLRQGRRKFLKQFPSLATDQMQAQVPSPSHHDLFDRSKLNLAERDVGSHAEALVLHRDLLLLRQRDPTFRAGQRRGAIDGAVLGPEALVIRWFDPYGLGDDRLLLVNLGVELRLSVAAEPLLAPPSADRRWRALWSSEEPRYGGQGTAEPETEELNWRLAGHAAVVMAPAPAVADEVRNPPGTV